MEDLTKDAHQAVVSALSKRMSEPLPLSSDVLAVGQELARAKGKGMLTGYLLLLRMRYEAWLEERVKMQIVRKLSARKHLADAQLETIEAETRLKESFYGGQIEEQRHATDLSLAKQQRLMTDLATFAAKGEAVSSGVLPAAAEPMVTVHISDDQIEALALRAVLKLEKEEPSEEAWAAYQKELRKQLPVNVAQEVERRILSMRSVLS